MTLTPGTRFGPYEILAPLGAGGMGEVYRARDARLERDVAIKTLPEAFSSDHGRLSRFIREAKILASLNHPNIGAIYGLEELPTGERFLVLELIDGETLADRLRRGALPVADALRVCGGISEALEAAHERGVIHRDLKPQNVMLPRRGGVKVLDFGLARKAPSSDLNAPADNSTQSLMLTAPAFQGGTPGYMSPEQVRGEKEDSSTDIFAFGSVLYECLTARRAFQGDTALQLVAAVLTREPDWSALPLETPAPVQTTLRRCLEKDTERRPRSIRDVRAALAQAPGVGDAAAALASATPNNIPALLTSFVGRGRELIECEKLLARARLLTLTGIGGCGKTRLAIRLAHVILDQYPDGIWFVDLAPIQDSDRVAQVVAKAIGVSQEPGRPADEVVVAHLSGRRALLVLDNCEHLLPVCAFLAKRLLMSAPSLRIVATSRETLGVPGEQNYPVPPLSLSHEVGSGTPGASASSEAVRLFVERARQGRPDFAMEAEDVEAVGEICRRLDGIPLAIELAAARVALLSVEQIRVMLKDVFRLLAGGESELPRHQTLRAAIQWSYDHLAPEEQRMFRSLSVFAGGATLEGATAVLGPSADEFVSLDLVTRLVDKSLVVVGRPEWGESRYSLLETVREYARMRLDEAGEVEPARTKHLRFYLAYVEGAAPMLLSAEQGRWLSNLDAEQENVLVAHAWCDQAEEGAEIGLRLAGGMRLYWLNRGLFDLGLRTSRAALARNGALATPPRGLALYAAGSLAYAQGYYDEARTWLEESVSLCRSLGDRAGVSRALSMLGTVATAQGRLPEARFVLQEVIAIAREMGDQRRLSVGLGSLAEVHRVEGALTDAIPLYEEALALAREIGNVDSAAVFLLNLAASEIHLGRLGESRVRAAEALRVVGEIGSKRLGQAVLDLVSGLAAAMGDGAKAARLHGASEELLGRMSAHREPVDAGFIAPLVAKARGEIGEAAFLAAVAAGRALSYDDVLVETRAWLEAV